MNKPIIHAFNTRRLYTKCGQRIAWTVIRTEPSDDGFGSSIVAMVDRDRMIDYVLVIDDDPTDASVLYAYDRAHQYRAPYNEADYKAAAELHVAMNKALDEVQCL